MNGKRKPPQFAGLSVARWAGLEPATFSVRSHSPSQTGRDSGGQGETNQRFYQGSIGFEGTGRDRERHPNAVRLRSKHDYYKGQHFASCLECSSEEEARTF